MRLYGEIKKTISNADGTLIVSGIASSESVDSDGEIILSKAISDAIPDYMRFGAVREMHDNKACGTALSMMVVNDKTMFEALVVDPIAVMKINTGVYKGFSIGGKITKRNDMNKNIIEGLKLVEVSLVDRPANPESIFTMVKFEDEVGAESVAKDTVSINKEENTMSQEQKTIKSEEIAKELPPQEKDPAQAQQQQDPIKLMKEAFGHLYKAVECMKGAGMSYEEEEKNEGSAEPKEQPQENENERAYSSKPTDLGKAEVNKLQSENSELKKQLDESKKELETLIIESTKAIRSVEAKGFLKAVAVSKEDDGVVKKSKPEPTTAFESLKEVYAKGGKTFGHNF